MLKLFKQVTKLQLNCYGNLYWVKILVGVIIILFFFGCPLGALFIWETAQNPKKDVLIFLLLRPCNISKKKNVCYITHRLEY